jgi:hypothetical protein
LLSPFKEGVCKIPFSSKLELGFLTRGPAILSTKSSSAKLATTKKEKKLSSSLGLISAYIPRWNHLVVA